MKILIVGLLDTNPQVARLVEEGERRGHIVHGCYASDLMSMADGKEIKVSLKDRDPIESYDVIYLWTIGKRRWEWQMALSFVQKKFNITVVNQSFLDGEGHFDSPSVLLQYIRQADLDVLYPKTHLLYNTRAVKKIKDDITYPAIVKLAYSGKGKGIYLSKNEDELLDKVKELQGTKELILVREFIPNDGDIRIFTVGYKAIGAMKRTPKEGDFRSNISQGGSGSEVNLSENPELVEISEKLSSDLKLEVAGVDIMINKETGKPYVLEVNAGPQYVGLEKYTSTNAALEIIKYLERLV